MRALALFLCAAAAQAEPLYPWPAPAGATRSLEEAFAPPAGYHRVPVAAGTFGAWLRRLPLRPPGTPVRSFRGEEIRAGDDPAVAAVATLDVGPRDLQQCADSIVRLHAEWRFAAGQADQIVYPLSPGHDLAFARWASGERPRIGKGDRVTWRRVAAPDRSHAALRAFLDVWFANAGTRSLDGGAARVARADLAAGAFFVVGGSPGHAVLVLDVAEDGAGHRRALLGQGFMPAQDFHVLAADGDPWFSLDGDTVVTPFWRPFPMAALRRF